MQKRKCVFIIAEAGVNHNGSLKTAKRLIDEAKRAGADAVKFQTFRACELLSLDAPKAGYQKKTTPYAESQYDMIKRLELDEHSHRVIISYCRKKNIAFISSPFDMPSIRLLKELSVKTIKIPSGEIVNVPYLRAVGRLRGRVIMSTGMAKINEIKKALDTLIRSGTPKRNITILHCTTEYPAPYDELNLLAMVSMKNLFGTSIGYSDHSLGIEAAIAACALGAGVIEKHFTLDKKMKGPDHKASLEPDEFACMVKAIRHVEAALGDGKKTPTPCELKNMKSIRKKVVASVSIKKGSKFTCKNTALKRNSSGVPASMWENVVGRKAKKDFLSNEGITV